MAPNLSYTKQLINYVKRNLKKGYPKESLKWALVNQGHSKIQIEKAIKKAEEELSKEAPILKTKPTIRREIIKERNEKVEFHKPKKKSFLNKFFG